jgi:hypothetical protein
MKNKKLLLLVVGLAALLGLQFKVIVPMMYDIAGSDLFLVESKDSASALPVKNEMTALAFSHCNSFIAKEVGEDKSVLFANQPTNVWSLGNYEYIVNADAEILPKDAPAKTHHYVCRIQYSNGDDMSGVANIENWNLEGISGLSE